MFKDNMSLGNNRINKLSKQFQRINQYSILFAPPPPQTGFLCVALAVLELTL
jgi:hypothetical protein